MDNFNEDNYNELIEYLNSEGIDEDYLLENYEELDLDEGIKNWIRKNMPGRKGKAIEKIKDRRNNLRQDFKAADKRDNARLSRRNSELNRIQYKLEGDKFHRGIKLPKFGKGRQFEEFEQFYNEMINEGFNEDEILNLVKLSIKLDEALAAGNKDKK